MALKSFLSIDDYYEDPNDIRDMALKLDFHSKENADYPGKEAYIENERWMQVKQDLLKLISNSNNEKIPDIKKNFKQGKFRIALEEDNLTRTDAIHQDVQKYSGIIYLSKNEDCKGGIGLYRCINTGATGLTREWANFISSKYGFAPGCDDFFKVAKQYMQDWDNWEKYGELPMRFNRAIILMARCFHASTGIFGKDIYSGRLTQHFEFYL